MKNIAIFSRMQNATTETFIKAHKERLHGNIFYLFGGDFPRYAENEGFLIKPLGLKKQVARRLKEKLGGTNSDYTPNEALTGYLYRNKIDVVLAEYGLTGAETTPVLKKAGVPLIVHFHGFDASNKAVLAAYTEKYNAMFAYASKIIAVSQVMKKMLIDIGAPEHKIVYNPYGPNEMFYNLQPDYSVNHFVSIGRFVDKKAPYFTLEAFRQLLARHPEARLTMAGEGELLDTCKNLAEYWNIAHAVAFPGAVAHQQVADLFQQSFCFLQHSITARSGDMEGTPVGILEAGAAALPVVSTRHAGIPDVVIENKTGLLVDEKDVAAMANAMTVMYENRKKTAEIGQAARKHIQNNFSIEKHIGIIQQLIDTI